MTTMMINLIIFYIQTYVYIWSNAQAMLQNKKNKKASRQATRLFAQVSTQFFFFFVKLFTHEICVSIRSKDFFVYKNIILIIRN